MKVAMTILNLDPIINDSRVRREGAALGRAQHEVELIAVRRSGETRIDHLDGMRLQTFELVSRRLSACALSWFAGYMEYVLKSFLILIRRRADVYHAHDLYALPAAYAAAKLMRAKVIYDSHELFTERPIEGRRAWAALERLLLNRVDVVLAASEDRADFMHAHYGARPRPRVILNCPSMLHRARTQGLRSSLPDSAREKLIVVYAGAVAASRRIEALVHAATEFDKEAVLAIVGARSAYRTEVLEPLVAALNLNHRVYFVDAVDSTEVVGFLSSADIGVVIYDNTCLNNFYCAPNKLFEYCMAGLAVIGCDFPAVACILREFRVGLTFDPESPTEVAKCVNAYAANREALANAKERTQVVREQYNAEREGEKLEQIYEELVDRRRG